MDTYQVSLDPRDARQLSSTIENLINMLDDLSPDCDLEDGADLEPSLGWSERGPQATAVFNASFDGRGSMHDDRELECEDEGAQCDDEDSLGWQDDGSQEHLSFGTETETDLGTTEEIDQLRRLEIGGDFPHDGEPDLGWAESFGKGIVGEQNCLDDREADDSDTEKNGDEGDYSGCEDDSGGCGYVGPSAVVLDIPDGAAVAERMLREHARRLPSGDIVREITDKRDDAKRQRTALAKPKSVGMIPHTTDGFVPEIDLRAHYWAAKGF